MLSEFLSKNTKTLLAVFVLAVLGGALFVIWPKAPETAEPIFCTQDAKLCSDGAYVGRSGPACAFAPCAKEDLIVIEDPHAYSEISSPLVVKGKARGFWFFEASFPVRVADENGTILATAIATAKTEWMTTEFVEFEAELNFPPPATQKGYLIFEKDNPSGLPENADELKMPVVFSQYGQKTRDVALYYYNSALDTDAGGNILCSRKGLVPVRRRIPITQTPVQDAIKLLLKGKENLTNEEISRGITTEYPLEGFSLKGASLKNNALTLEFNDPNNKTGGGACRVGILWFQIEATAKQFETVKEVTFFPEELFQP